MSPKAQKVLQEALRLSPRARGDIGATLIRSLDVEEDPEVEASWAAEIERRIREVDEGKVKLIPWEQVRRSLRAGLKRRGSKKA